MRVGIRIRIRIPRFLNKKAAWKQKTNRKERVWYRFFAFKPAFWLKKRDHSIKIEWSWIKFEFNPPLVPKDECSKRNITFAGSKGEEFCSELHFSLKNGSWGVEFPIILRSKTASSALSAQNNRNSTTHASHFHWKMDARTRVLAH